MWNSLRIYNFLIPKYQRKTLTEGSRDVTRDGARRSIFHSTPLIQKFQLPAIVCKNQLPRAAFWCTDYMAAILGHLTSVLNLSMRTKTGIPRFLGQKMPLSQSLYWRPPADQKASGLWVRDCDLPIYISMVSAQLPSNKTKSRPLTVAHSHVSSVFLHFLLQLLASLRTFAC